MKLSQKARRAAATAALLVPGIGVIAGAPPATATSGPYCGDTITANTVLQHDVVTAAGTVCVGDGIVIGASNITLDLNGKKITGDGAVSIDTSTPNGANSVRIVGDAGVRLEGHSNVTIKDSTTHGGATGRDCSVNATGWGSSRISGFDVGVLIVEGDSNADHTNAHPAASDNTVQGLTIEENIGSVDSDYGEGVVINNASNNTVVDNRIIHNGPWAGVGLYEDIGHGSSGNVVGKVTVETSPCDGGNLIYENDVTSGHCVVVNGTGTGSSSQDQGIRFEPGVTNNTAENNNVERSGLDGIIIFFGNANNGLTSGNLVKGNIVKANGFHEWVGPVDAYPRADCPASTANSTSPGPGWHQKTHRKGDGIRVFGPTATSNATDNTIEGNTVCANAQSGIRVDGGDKSGTNSAGVQNNVKNNNSGDTSRGCASNGVFTATTFPRYDLYDTNTATPCGSNYWFDNQKAGSTSTENPTCIN